MEKAGNLRARAAGLGHQWSSFQKVEEMLSKAIRQQQDLRNMLLLIHSPPQNYYTSPADPELTHTLSPHVVRALKVKLENAMDWCHLALCRLKEILSRRNIDVIPGVQWSQQGSGLFSSFNETAAQSCDGGEDAASLIAPDDDDAHRHRLVLRSLPGSILGLDSAAHWDMLTDDQAQFPGSDLRASSGATTEAPIQGPSSCHLSARPHRLVTSLNSCGGSRPRSCGPKRDREEARGDEKDIAVSVVFQELKPGGGMKKGIPDDGHRGWKKYGNKTIQNSNFSRGYYKCNMQDCGAKKMVQPTDKNPAIFEVTYVGTHTCSTSTSRNRRHRTSTSAPTPSTTIDPGRTTPPQQQADMATAATPPAASADILVQTKIARLLIKNQTCSITSNPSSNVSSQLDYPTSVGNPASVGTSELDVLPTSMADHPNELSRSKLDADVCSPESVDKGDVGLMSLRDDEDGEIGFHSLLWQDVLESGCSWSVDI